MKFTNLFTLLIILTIALSLMSSIASKSKKIKRSNNLSGKFPIKTASRGDSGSKVKAIFNHIKLNCANGVIQGFHLYRPTSSTVGYEYRCLESKAVHLKKTIKMYTDLNEVGQHTKGTEYLDRHDVKCAVGYGIKSFYVQSFSNGNKMRYVYECVEVHSRTCHEHSTSPTHATSDHQLIYLDRQRVQARADDYFLNRFHMRSHNGQYWYEIKSCDAFVEPPKKVEDISLPAELNTRLNVDNAPFA